MTWWWSDSPCHCEVISSVIWSILSLLLVSLLKAFDEAVLASPSSLSSSLHQEPHLEWKYQSVLYKDVECLDIYIKTLSRSDSLWGPVAAVSRIL